MFEFFILKIASRSLLMDFLYFYFLHFYIIFFMLNCLKVVLHGVSWPKILSLINFTFTFSIKKKKKALTTNYGHNLVPKPCHFLDFILWVPMFAADYKVSWSKLMVMYFRFSHNKTVIFRNKLLFRSKNEKLNFSMDSYGWNVSDVNRVAGNF